MIESACLMLDHLEEFDISKKIRSAIAKVIEEGKVRTYDMMKMPGNRR
jgi:isocitrate/isopropylmalate dehydrogenase